MNFFATSLVLLFRRLIRYSPIGVATLAYLWWLMPICIAWVSERAAVL